MRAFWHGRGYHGGLRARGRSLWIELLLERGGLIGLVALVAYGALAAPVIVDGDNAELATLGHTGGLAHPSGYPAYVLWLRAWSWLPGTPAHAAALATALLGAATVVVLVHAARAWGARTGAATLATALFAGAPIALRACTEAEVFAGNDLICALVLWLAATGGPARGAWRGGLLGLVAGVGLANHLTCALLAPVGVLGIARAVRESRAALATSIIGLAGGALPYMYAFVAPDTPMAWGRVGDLDGLVGLVTRRDYGGATAFSPVGEPVSAWAQLAAFAATLGRAWLWLPAAAGVAMLGAKVAYPAFGERETTGKITSETRWGWAALALSWLVAGPLLVTRFDVPLDPVGLSVCQRFHILPALLLAIPVAAVLDALPIRPPRAGRVLAAALALPTAVALSLPYLGRVHTAAVQSYAENILGSLPDGAVLVVGEDYVYAGTQYAQWALGKRPDVIVVDDGLLVFPWYRARLAARGLAMPPGAPTGGWVALHAVAAGKRVYVDLKQKDVLAALPTYPWGAVLAVAPRGASPPPLDDLLDANRALYSAFQLDYAAPVAGDEYAAVIHRHYAAMWELLARALDAAHRPDDANVARGIAQQLAPQ